MDESLNTVFAVMELSDKLDVATQRSDKMDDLVENISSFSELPPEVVCHIFNQLEVKDVVPLQCLNKNTLEATKIWVISAMDAWYVKDIDSLKKCHAENRVGTAPLYNKPTPNQGVDFLHYIHYKYGKVHGFIRNRLSYTSIQNEIVFIVNSERQIKIRYKDWNEVCRKQAVFIVHARLHQSDSSDFAQCLENGLFPTSIYKFEKGDIVSLPNPYRNDTKKIVYQNDKTNWKCIELDDHIDDYGHVPKAFSVITEYPINYWNEDLIDHNDYVHCGYFSTIPKALRKAVTNYCRTMVELEKIEEGQTLITKRKQQLFKLLKQKTLWSRLRELDPRSAYIVDVYVTVSIVMVIFKHDNLTYGLYVDAEDETVIKKEFLDFVVYTAYGYGICIGTKQDSLPLIPLDICGSLSFIPKAILEKYSLNLANILFAPTLNTNLRRVYIDG